MTRGREIAIPRAIPRLAAAGAAAVALLVVGVAAAGAARTTLKPTPGCDLAVINDWADNNQVDKLYAIPCYTDAINRLSRLSDIQGYSSAIDDIRRARREAIKAENRTSQSHDGGSSTTPLGSGGPGQGGGSGPSGGSPDPSGGNGPVQTGIDKIGPSNATSVPLPLIVLGGLAVLLLLTAGLTFLARRIQARRMSPAPAPARRR